MNKQRTRLLFTAAVLAAVCAVSLPVMADNEPVGTTFTYQGQLTEAGEPVSGMVDLTFALFDQADGGTPLSVLVADDFEVGEDGRFTIDLDFGDEFDGGPRWLEIGVNSVTLSPRQPIMAAPHAMVATTAANVPTKAIVGNYGGITGVGTLDSLDVAGNIFATSSNIPIRAIRDAPSGTFPGIWGESNSASSGTSGVRGYANHTAPGANAAGVWGRSLSETDNGIGVRGTHDADGIGVKGESNGGFGGFFLGKGYFSGNLGIGVTDPQRRLDILGTGARISSLVVDGPRLELKGDSITSPLGFTVGALDFVDVDDDFVGGISYTRSLFGERLWLSAGGEGRLAIDQDGRVGILADFPRQQLSVGDHLDLYSGSINNPTRPSVRASSASHLIVNASGSGATFINHDSGTGGVRFHNGTPGSAGGEIMRLTGDGRLGLGTTAPVVKLHVIGGSDTSPSSGGYLVLGPTNSSNISMDNNEIMARNNGNVTTLHLNADGGFVHVGQNSSGTGRLITPVLQITGGSDLSEKFDVAMVDDLTPQPGMVVCIDPHSPGKLIPSARAYDRTVAGIISGANGINTGMMMGQEGTEADGAFPVALTGRVYVMVDATSGGGIQPGDLLTTSDTPGHAMKVEDFSRAHGAIIGKAMSSLTQGERGLVLVLVSLQ